MNQPSKFTLWLRLFWTFLKVNLLTTAGPTSVGLLYKETVGTIMTEAQFVEAVGFSNLVPGSEALKLAMFIGYAAGGVSGMFAALLGTWGAYQCYGEPGFRLQTYKPAAEDGKEEEAGQETEEQPLPTCIRVFGFRFSVFGWLGRGWA